MVYTIQMYSLKSKILENTVFFLLVVSIPKEVKRQKVAAAIRYGRDWPVHGEDVFEVPGGVDQWGQTEPEQGGVLTVENDAAIDHIQE